MKKRLNVGKYKYRILFIVLIFAIYLLYNSYPCLKLSLTEIPDKITRNITEKTKAIVFLYGNGICGTCPQGKFLFSQKKDRCFIYCS
jgi:hypothetical protein